MAATSVEDLIEDIEGQGIRLWVRQGELHFSAPRGALTDDRRAALRERRDQVIDLLRRRYPPPRVATAEAVWLPSDSQLQLMRDTDVGNMQAIFYWPDRLDMSVLLQSISLLVERHDMLRTHFLNDDVGRCWAVTERGVTVPLHVVDMRHIPEERRQAEARAAARALVLRPFDVGSGALVRFGVIRISEEASAFLFAVHHSVFDGASRMILGAELFITYRCLLNREPPRLLPQAHSFREHVGRQREVLERSHTKPYLQYWASRLAGTQPFFHLPPDRKTPVEPDEVRRALVRRSIPAESLEALRTFCRQKHSTLFVVTAAAFGLMLSRWTGRDDICFWVCDSGRDREDLDRIIGCFVNFWPLRISLAGEPAFAEVCERVQHARAEAMPHSQVTVQALKPVLDRLECGPRSPSAVFNFVSARPRGTPPGGKINISRLDWEPEETRLAEGSPLGLTISMRETEDSLAWTIRHASHAFEESTIERVSDDLRQLLLDAAASTAAPGARMPGGGTHAPG